jgi:hypothetical protein
MLHHSPTRSRLRAMGHCMFPKLLRCTANHRSFSDYHHSSSFVAIIMQASPRFVQCIFAIKPEVRVRRRNRAYDVLRWAKLQQ